jgi:PAS domain S-box-containing protein
MPDLPQETWRSLMENAPNIILMVDREGIIKYINRTVPGLKPEDVIGKNQYEFIEPEHREQVREKIERVFDTGEIGTYETKGTGPDGSVSWYSTSVGPIKTDGKITAVSLFTSDVTDRKRVESELGESEERYKALFDGAAEGVLVADIASRKFKFANPAGYRMLGYTENEFREMKVDDIHPREAMPEVIAAFEAQARGEKPLAPDIPVLRKDKTLFYADICTAPVKLDGVDCNVGFFTDVTERKEAEESLRKAKDELIAQQSSAISELLTPVIQVWDEILVLPLIGTIDTLRAQQIVENLLESIVRMQALVVIMDVTGVPVVDTKVANHLLQTTEAARMLGAEVILTGVSPSNAQTLVKLGVELGNITARSTLQEGLKLAFGMTRSAITAEARQVSG